MSRVPKLLSGCDVKSLPLTPADAFLLSRVDAAADEHELALVTGFPAEQVAAMLDRLATLGAIELDGAGASQTRLRATPAPAASSASPAPAPTGEDEQLRRRTLARKLSGTHSIQTAAAHARPPATEADVASALRASEALNAQQEQAATEARRAQIARCLEEGKRALARRDHAGAIHHHRLAESLAPDDPAVRAICEEAIRTAAGALADGFWAQAVDDEREERWEEAALCYSRVCAGRPDDALAHDRAANAALRSANVRPAVAFARRAILLAPASAIFRITLARAYAAAGLETSSDKELDRALELGPGDARIAGLVARLRALARRTGKTG